MDAGREKTVRSREKSREKTMRGREKIVIFAEK
jgi:hypothetical protein